MTTDEKLDLILNKLDGIEDAIVNVNKRLTILEGDTHQLNLKIDEIRTWTRLDLKDNPFMKTRAIA
jgi:predicted  nucleic acid-binding Zn-ribbon protein